MSLMITKQEIDSRSGSLPERYSALVENTPAGSIDPFFIDRCTTSGKGAKGIAEKITLTLHHHKQVERETDAEKKEIRDAEFLTSRLADREMQEGEVVHLSDGYFFVEKTFVAGGAYVSLLQDLEKKMPPKLICRGTALRRTATGGYLSGLNDVQKNIGSLGVDSIWRELSTYLRDAHIAKLSVFGKSLGGAHAQILSVKLEKECAITVDRLVTVCSVGVSDEIHALFKEHIAKRATPFTIDVIRNGGQERKEIDHIPLAGGAHLGHSADRTKCKVNLTYIHTQNSIQALPEVPSWDLYHFIASFISAHCRQTTLQNFFIKKIDDEAVDTHLMMGRRVEWYRQLIARPLSLFV